MVSDTRVAHKKREKSRDVSETKYREKKEKPRKTHKKLKTKNT
jgi:hypothetical protein